MQLVRGARFEDGVMDLSRQPHGFERLGAVRELLAASDPPVLQCQDVRQLHVDGGSAARSMAGKAHPQEHLVAILFGLQRLHLEIGICLFPAGNLLPDRIERCTSESGSSLETWYSASSCQYQSSGLRSPAL